MIKIIGYIALTIFTLIFIPRFGMMGTAVSPRFFKTINLKKMSWFYVEIANNGQVDNKITVPAFLCEIIGDTLGVIGIIIILIMESTTTNPKLFMLICSVFWGTGFCITISFRIYFIVIGRKREKKWREEQQKEENRKGRFI